MVSDPATIDAPALRAFVEVARRLSVTAGAAALNQPKSRVSKTLSRLERTLGVRLLERSTRRVALTPAGIVLRSRAESLLAEMDRLAEDVREEAAAVRGVVRMTAPPELGALLAERFIPGVLAAHPGLDLAMELGYAFEDLLDPRFDLAFRLGSVHDERLVARRLGEFRRILVASAAYLDAQPVRRIEDLARCNCLAFSAIELQATWTLEGRRQPPRDAAVRGRLAIHGFTALLGAARSGVGVARVPAFVARTAIERRELIRVLPEWAAPPTEVFLVHRFGHERIQRVRAVIEAAQERVGALLGEQRVPESGTS
jgi:LysR family transcriptional regulator AphB